MFKEIQIIARADTKKAGPMQDIALYPMQIQ